MFAAPALGRLVRGRVRPLISLAYPVPDQVPRLVCAAPPQLVRNPGTVFSQSTAVPVGESLARRQADRSQQKVSNRPSRDITRGPDAATHEHVTAPVGTAHHALRAFGTKRPWVRIPPPRQSEVRGQRLAPYGFMIDLRVRIGPYSCEEVRWGYPTWY